MAVTITTVAGFVKLLPQGPPGPAGSGGAGAVTSVAGRTGAVTLAVADVVNAVPDSRTVNSQPLSTNVILTKSDVGLGSADNTPDAAKPVSTAQAAAIALKQNALGFTAENAANKGAANGYAPLDGTAKIAAAYLPSYVDDVLDYANIAAFPVTGETGKIYVTLDTNFEYRWSGSVYIQLVASPGSTDALAEGATNKYFTNPRAIAAPLTGYAAGAGTISATDSILSAIQKNAGNDALKAPIVGANLTGATVNGVTLSTTAGAATVLKGDGSYGAVSGGSGDFKSDGTVPMTGAIASTVGTMTSSVANGETAVAFNKNTGALSTAGALLERWQNNGVTKASVDKDGRWLGKEFALADVYIGQRTAGNSLFDIYTSGGVAMIEVQGGGGGLIINNAQCPIFGIGNNTVNTSDIAFGRNAAGIGEINNGTAGTFRDLKLRNLITDPKTVAGLTAAATAGNGARSFVTDALTPTFGATVAGGGAVSVPVYSDGTNWKVG